jgi:hypothetical protein
MRGLLMGARFADRFIVRIQRGRAYKTPLQCHTVILVFSASIFMPDVGPYGLRPGPAPPASSFLIAPPRFATPAFRL